MPFQGGRGGGVKRRVSVWDKATCRATVWHSLKLDNLFFKALKSFVSRPKPNSPFLKKLKGILYAAAISLLNWNKHTSLRLTQGWDCRTTCLILVQIVARINMWVCPLFVLSVCPSVTKFTVRHCPHQSHYFHQDLWQGEQFLHTPHFLVPVRPFWRGRSTWPIVSQVGRRVLRFHRKLSE